MALIEVDDLSVHYPRAAQPSLRGVTLSVERGETLLLLGPSGSGKSTLGLCLTGLVPASIPARMEGRIRLDGQDAALLSVAQRTAAIGMVFQDPEAQFCMLTVEDEVAFGLENLATPPEEMDGRIAEALALVGLSERRRERVDRLSGGQKQRLSLACALARRPAILFLDEPTANLDPQTRHEFFQFLHTLRRERPALTMLIVEHILDDLITLVDRVALLQSDGRLLAVGSPAQVFDARDDELDALGIWLPQVTALAHKLRRLGLLISPLPLTVEQAAASLDPLLAQRSLPSLQSPRGTSAPAAPAVEVRNLSFRYPHGLDVLRDVSLTVPAGSFFALVGPNGAGKTTLSAHLADILRPPPGRVQILGDDIATLTTAQITERVGYVFQNPEHQFVEQRVDQELAYSLRLRKRPPQEIEATVAQLLDAFGLETLRARNPFALSQGQKRRLSVATMLAVGQRILVLDEPTFGQDRHTAHALMERLCALHAQGVTLLIITHDMQLVADYAQSAAVLCEGRLRYVGPTAQLFMQADVLEEAALRPPPLHMLARLLSVAYANGSLPLSIRAWYPFFGLIGVQGDQPLCEEASAR
jgi:energy-coupling factor transporter ATP-binding protein EcfA2